MDTKFLLCTALEGHLWSPYALSRPASVTGRQVYGGSGGLVHKEADLNHHNYAYGVGTAARKLHFGKSVFTI